MPGKQEHEAKMGSGGQLEKKSHRHNSLRAWHLILNLKDSEILAGRSRGGSDVPDLNSYRGIIVN